MAMSDVKKNIVGSLLMNTGVLLFAEARLLDPKITALAGSSGRVLCNLLVACLLHSSLRKAGTKPGLWGHKKNWLLLWGLLGSATILGYFLTVSSHGVGIANFLLTANGSLLVLMQFLLHRQGARGLDLALAILCLVGCALLSLEAGPAEARWTLLWGCMSACSAALAYRLAGGVLVKESSISLMFYWSLVNGVVHVLLFVWQRPLVPDSAPSIILILGSGLLAALGQYFVNGSFQGRDSSLIAIISYLSCVVTLGFDLVFFGKRLAAYQYLGAAIIVGAGLFAMRARRSCQAAPGPSTKSLSPLAALGIKE